MKPLIPAAAILVLALNPALDGTCGAGERRWRTGGPDDGTVHSLGSGRMCVYEQGPEIITAYTGPYSSPSFIRVRFASSDPVDVHSTRQAGTAIWRHVIVRGSTQVGEMTDFVDAQLPLFARRIQTRENLTLRVELSKYVDVIDNSGRWRKEAGAKGRLLVIPSGTVIYQTYVYPRVLCAELLAVGAATIHRSGRSGDIEIRCEPGETFIYIAGGPEYPEAIGNARKALSTGFHGMLARTDSSWQAFTGRRTDFSKVLPDDAPHRAELLRIIDDVAVLIKTQQSSEGAVLAGYPYPLGYVRDQYGVSRGLLKLGYCDEAKRILQSYWRLWKRYGVIHNAQAIGLDGVFHIHENDEVETPGYLTVQAFDLLAASHDTAFVLEITPMLRWAFLAQKKLLVKGMLPFNGDETYIAGGLLPRSAINDGSAEATMLFVRGGEELMEWEKAHHMQSDAVIAEYRTVLDSVRNEFNWNFWHDGVLRTNNPERATAALLPEFRHGVCEKAGEHCLMKRYSGIVWTERDENGRYLCAACLAEGPMAAARAGVYSAASVTLAPLYLNAALLTHEQTKTSVEGILTHFLSDGSIDSGGDTSVSGRGKRTVGYEYGLLLLAATRLGMSNARPVYERTLSLADPAGAWAEYYLNGIPNGTRCRPWESAINLEALISWAMHGR